MKENHVMSVDSQNNLTTSKLNESNINFMKNMDHKINQLGTMNLHNMKYMSKIRRNFLIVLLALIILAAAGLAGGLGFSILQFIKKLLMQLITKMLTGLI